MSGKLPSQEIQTLVDSSSMESEAVSKSQSSQHHIRSKLDSQPLGELIPIDTINQNIIPSSMEQRREQAFTEGHRFIAPSPILEYSNPKEKGCACFSVECSTTPFSWHIGGDSVQWSAAAGQMLCWWKTLRFLLSVLWCSCFWRRNLVYSASMQGMEGWNWISM